MEHFVIIVKGFYTYSSMEITKLHDRLKKKKWNSHVWNDLTFEWYEDALIFRVFIFTFLFRTNGKKKHLDKTDFRHCYGDFFEAATRDHKNRWSQLYVQGFFSSGTRNIDNNFFQLLSRLE